MDWIKNNHSAVIIGIVFCFGLALFLFASGSTFISYDAWWHLKTGQDFLYNGLSPRIDHYSFTHNGEAITSPPYLFQVILAVFVSIFGTPAGFELIRMFSFVLLLVAIGFYYRKIQAPWPIVLVTLPYIFVFLLFRFHHIRPEIFDLTLVVLALILYLRARASFSHGNLAWIVAFQLLWVNYHAPILGYVIFFGLFLDKAIDIVTRRPSAPPWQHWVGWGAVLFVVGFLNPDLQHPLFWMLSSSADWGSMLVELTSTTELIPNSSLLWCFWLVSAYLVVVLSIQRHYGFALLVVIFAFQSWSSANLLGISGLIVFSLLAFTLSQTHLGEFLGRLKPRIRGLVVAVVAVTSLCGLIVSTTQAVDANRKTNTDDIPVDIATYLQQAHPQGGKIFNRMRDGGYLAYRLAPEFRIYIDGRTNVLYPIEFLQRFAALYSGEHGESTAAEVERYQIDFALYPLELAGFPVTDNRNGMEVEYVSKEFVLFSKREQNFPLSGRLMYYPMCWQARMQPALADEYDIARDLLPDDSALLPLLRSMNALHNSAGVGAYFDAIDFNGLVSDYHRRLLGYVALAVDEDRHAFESFRAIQSLEAMDLLMMAHAAANYEDVAEAEQYVQAAVSEHLRFLTGRNLTVTELAIAASLMEHVKQRQPLSRESQDWLDQVKSQLQQANPSLVLPMADIVPHGHCEKLFAVTTMAAN